MTLCGCAQAIGGMHGSWAGEEAKQWWNRIGNARCASWRNGCYSTSTEQKARFTLTRTADVPARVRREDLTLSEAERFWKPRNCAAHKGG